MPGGWVLGAISPRLPERRLRTRRRRRGTPCGRPWSLRGRGAQANGREKPADGAGPSPGSPPPPSTGRPLRLLTRAAWSRRSLPRRRRARDRPQAAARRSRPDAPSGRPGTWAWGLAARRQSARWAGGEVFRQLLVEVRNRPSWPSWIVPSRLRERPRVGGEAYGDYRKARRRRGLFPRLVPGRRHGTFVV